MEVQHDNTISLTTEEVHKWCKPGQGANTCIWLTVGCNGFDCQYYLRPTGLQSRWHQGLTAAKRNGCDKVKALGLTIRSTEAPTLQDLLGGEDESWDRPRVAS